MKKNVKVAPIYFIAIPVIITLLGGCSNFPTIFAQPTSTSTATAIPTATPIPTKTPIPTPTPISASPGKWSAEAELFGTIEFSVSEDGKSITIILLDHKEPFKCGAATVEGILGLTNPTSSINDLQFTIITSNMFLINYEITIEGKFDETGKASSGIWTVDAGGTICTGNWVGKWESN